MSTFSPVEPTRGGFGFSTEHPYELALRDPQRVVRFHDVGSRSASADAPLLEVGRFRDDADDVDHSVVASTRGAVLDVGCGPGRIVKAAIAVGRGALGVDVSTAAIALARERGLPVVRRSVFQRLPREGTWGAVLLLDGNIGIGGNPAHLLTRCATLVHPTGKVVVEAHREADTDRAFTGVLTDDLGRSSVPFAWAEVGARALRQHAAAAGLLITREWSGRERTFVELARS